MEVTESRVGSATTLKIVGRVDSSVAKALEQKVLDIASRDGHIVVDLHGMNYVSSACFARMMKDRRPALET